LAVLVETAKKIGKLKFEEDGIFIINCHSSFTQNYFSFALFSSFNGYCSKDTSKESEVILTKFMVMERDTCSAFFKYSHLIWEDVILNNGEGPLWNGEDIFMSLVSNHVYDAGSENINYAMDWLDVRSAPEELKDYTDGKFDISGGFSGLRFWSFGWWRSLLNRNRHYSYRGVLWKQAKERLELSEPYVR
jgi:hypothetical protein